jgi:hypothetical protein
LFDEEEEAVVVGERSQLGKERLSRARAETEKEGGWAWREEERGRWVPGVARVVSGGLLVLVCESEWESEGEYVGSESGEAHGWERLGGSRGLGRRGFV